MFSSCTGALAQPVKVKYFRSQLMTSFDKTLNLILIDFTSFKEWFFRMSSIFRGGSISVLYLYVRSDSLTREIGCIYKIM